MLVLLNYLGYKIFTMELQKVRDLKVVTLLDNSVNTLGPLAHWGLSLLLTYNDFDGKARRLLMDTGSDRDSFIRNAKLLKVDLAGIDAIVLSHGHLDHTAATVEVAEANPGIRIHAHPSAFDERYYVNNKGDRRHQSPPKGEGLPELKATGARIIFSHGPVEVSPGVWATGEVPRTSLDNHGA